MHIQSFFEEDGNQGSGDSAKSSGGRLILVSLCCPMSMLVQTMLCDTSVGDLECVWQ
jgi:hypothetical protein